MKKLNIAIVGLGNIGSYLYKYLEKNKRILSEKNNCIPNVLYVSAKNKKRKRNFIIPKKKWLNNYLESNVYFTSFDWNDSDSDGFSDSFEIEMGTNPLRKVVSGPMPRPIC